MDRFVGMAVYVKVVESKSFAAAARHFGLSRAMVSKHVNAIEQRLGARLLNRTTRRVSPTEVGQDYYERSRRIIADLEEAEAAAGEQQAVPRGRLKVTTSVSFGMSHLAPVVAEFLTRHPEMTVELGLDDRYVDLVAEGFDLAVRIGRLADSSLIARRLAPVPMLVCASPRYLERRGTPATPRDLLAHDCLSYTYATTPGLWQFSGPGGAESVDVSGRFLANNADALRALALQGHGIVYLPSFMVEHDVEAGRLQRLLPAHKGSELALHAVYPHSRHLSAKVRAFVDVLVDRFGRPHARSG